MVDVKIPLPAFTFIIKIDNFGTVLEITAHL